MATVKNPEVATPAAVVVATPAVKKVRKVVTLVDRVKTQLSAAALKNKLSIEEIDTLATHLEKLKALLS